MSHHVVFETDGGERVRHVATYELVDGGWITLIDAASGGVQTVPAHAVNRVVLDPDGSTPTDTDGMNHLIRFVDGMRADIDGVALASGYEISKGWLLYVDAVTDTAELCPAHTVAAIDVDTSSIDEGR